MARGRAWSEEDLVRLIRRIFPIPRRQVPVSIGDDAAVLCLPRASRLVLTTDQMVEGIHFRRSTHPPHLLGEKALAVNLSDLAAMGALPRWALLSLFLPPDLSRADLEAVLRGMARRARQSRVELIGGNITVSKVLALDLALVGTLAAGARPLLRRGARPGDTLFVSGRLGGSATGLYLLEGGWRWRGGSAWKRGAPPDMRQPATRALKLHLAPEPQVEIGSLLVRHGLASAAMDLSDGLSRDLWRLCEASGVGARLESNALPLDPSTVKLVGEKEALRLALHGGEDYQLLFTVRRSRRRELSRYLPSGRLYPIGRIVPKQEGIMLEDEAGRARPLLPLGYDHFRASRTPQGSRRR